MRRVATVAVVLSAFVAIAAAPPPATTRALEFVVVVNSANPTTTIARDQLSRLFLKRTAAWPDGKPAEPVDLPTTDRTRALFTRTVHGKSVGAVRAFWQQQIFSGRDVPPPEKPGAAEVIAFVGTHPGAVGYVPVGHTLGPAVKSIAIEGHAP